MTINVLGLDHVVIRVSDVERALDFYCGMLGLLEERRVESIGLIQLRAGRSMIDLIPSASPIPSPGNVDHVCLRIESFEPETLADHLRAHGVEPGAVERRYGAEGQGPSMYVLDPDGNTIELKGPPDGG